jgi:preprotein translocase subunit Sec63
MMTRYIHSTCQHRLTLGTILSILCDCLAPPHSPSDHIQISSQTKRYISNPISNTHLINTVNYGISINCSCEACENKRKIISTRERKALYKPQVIRTYVLLAIGWGIVGYMTYRISTTKFENVVWDPYVVLGLPTSSSLETIKSHYKKLSKTLHPDKIKLVGNMTKEMVEEKFVAITKAYKA